MAPRKSPRDSACPHCGKLFAKGGLELHMRHVKCSPCSTASPRKWQRVRCRHCSRSFPSVNSLRVHVSTRHAREYAKSPGSMKDHRAPYKSSSSGSKDHRGRPEQGAHSSTRRISSHRSPRAPGKEPSQRAPAEPEPQDEPTRRIWEEVRRRQRSQTDASRRASGR